KDTMRKRPYGIGVSLLPDSADCAAMARAFKAKLTIATEKTLATGDKSGLTVMATKIRNMRRSIAIPSRPTSANCLLLRSFRLEMTIAVAGEDSLFSLFWSIQPP